MRGLRKGTSVRGYTNINITKFGEIIMNAGLCATSDSEVIRILFLMRVSVSENNSIPEVHYNSAKLPLDRNYDDGHETGSSTFSGFRIEIRHFLGPSFRR